MTTHTVNVQIILEVDDDLAVREAAFRLIRERMEPAAGDDSALMAQLTDDPLRALGMLVSWQIVGAGPTLQGVSGIRIVNVQVPPVP